MPDQDDKVTAMEVEVFITQKAINATHDVIHGACDLLGADGNGWERVLTPEATRLQARFAEVIRDFLRAEVPEVSGMVGEGE